MKPPRSRNVLSWLTAEPAFARLGEQATRLAALEAGATEAQQQVDLFATPPETDTAGPSPLELALAQINPDALSPREALEALYALQRLHQRSA
jgi:DNA mismatch repair protein MutS